MPSPLSHGPVGNVPLSGPTIVDALLFAERWGQGSAGTGATVTYSFPGPGAAWAVGTPSGYMPPYNFPSEFLPLDEAQKASLRSVLSSYSAVANIQFVEVADTPSSVGDIRVSSSPMVQGAIGVDPWAAPIGGDIWFNPAELSNVAVGTAGYALMLHEVGHALGLKHPFEGASVLSAEENNTHFTVMSYTQDFPAPQTPQLYDVLALQYLYGANRSYRTGADLYALGDGEKLTLWDAGGVDTVSVAGQTVGAVLNLTPGTFSSVGRISANFVSAPAINNIAIAFGTWIENATGSALADEITGNALHNILTGGGGNDRLDGRTGTDVAVYSGLRAEYDITGAGVGFSVADRVPGRDGTDTLTNIEILRFADLDLRIISTAVAIRSVSGIHSAQDGLAMFREVASDDAIKEPMEDAHARLEFSPGGGAALGGAERDLVWFTERNPELRSVEGRGGDDVYIVQWVPGPLTGGDPRIVEAENGGNDTVWVSQSDYILPNGVENLVSMTERGVRMLANDGDNKFIGGPGEDQLFSGFGDDIVYGREGNDLIVGGAGTDALFGGEGNDSFAWERSHVGDDDKIWDWNLGDRLDLRGLGGVTVTQDGADTQVWYDPNQDGIPDAHIVTVIGTVKADIEAAIML